MREGNPAVRAADTLRAVNRGELVKELPRIVRVNLASFLGDPWGRRYVKLWSWMTYDRHYDAPLDPFRVLWVDPHDIVYHQTPKPTGGSQDKMFSYVLPGDWDQNLPRFEEHPVYHFIRDRYLRGMQAEETDFFEHFQEMLLERDDYWNGCESVEDFHERCAYLDGLYEEIRDHGIKTTEQLRAEGRYPNPFPDNIHINIGRDGELIYLNGRHRLSFAKILDIETLPVNVMVRHSDWQSVRDAVVRSNNPVEVDSDIKRYLDHPDVEYLSSDD